MAESSLIRTALLEASSLLSNSSCAACTEGELVLCQECARKLQAEIAQPRQVQEHAPALRNRDLPVTAAGSYGHVLALVILEFKKHGNPRLARVLNDALQHALGVHLAVLNEQQGRCGQANPGSLAGTTGLTAHGGGGPGASETSASGAQGSGASEATVLLVPIPSSRSAFIRRGFDPVRLLLAHGVRRGMVVPGCRVAALLAHRPGIPTGQALLPRWLRSGNGQKGLGAQARADRLARAFRVGTLARMRYGGPDRTQALAGVRCVLIDDVLTTGATLAAAQLVLQKAGAQLCGAVVIAAARAPARTGD